MTSYNALVHLLDGIAGDDKDKRLDILRSNIVADMSYEDFRVNIKPTCIDESEFQKQVSVLVLNKLFWSLIPKSVLESPDPNFRRIAENIFKSELGITDPDKGLITNMATIFKRVRRYYRDGRNTTRLDLSSSIHDSLLKEQNGRCSLCFYEFKNTDIDFSLENNSELLCDNTKFGKNDLSIPNMSRRPELDHIIPHFLGGDKPCNWQILCQTCNQGKSSSLMWIFRPGWAGLSRISDGLDITHSMRYMVLARDLRCLHPYCTHQHGSKELRIRKINPDKLIYTENVKTFCEECLV